MEQTVKRRMDAIRNLARNDVEYAQMRSEMRELEKRYDKLLGGLPYEQQDIICDFVSLCEGMSWRMLEIACTLMNFPNEE
ncbi:MAG: hypothetical protein J6J18_04050 [Oscillospiraceae bacterium]|nr:hypothetical protein [Oscillospiraceae bacterium]